MSAPIEASVFFAVGCIAAFLVGVTAIAPWWRSEPARSMVALSGTILVAAMPSVLHYMFGWTPSQRAFAWFLCGVWLTVGVIHLWRLAAFWRTQRDARSTRRPR